MEGIGDLCPTPSSRSSNPVVEWIDDMRPPPQPYVRTANELLRLDEWEGVSPTDLSRTPVPGHLRLWES